MQATQPFAGRQFGFEAYMPAIATSALPSETARYVREAYREIDEGPRVGIVEERNTGKVPVHIDESPPYAGVTEFDPKYAHDGLDVESRRVGISDSLPTYVKIGRKRLNYKKRVARHEFRHVLSEKLLRYMTDLTPHQRTLIMEAYAEFAGIKGKTEDKETVLLTTPYTPAVKFGYFVDMFYKSEKDGKQGFAAFIRDIQYHKSAKEALYTLGRNIREAVASGVDVARAVESKYKSELHDALRKVAAHPRYLN